MNTVQGACESLTAEEAAGLRCIIQSAYGAKGSPSCQSLITMYTFKLVSQG